MSTEQKLREALERIAALNVRMIKRITDPDTKIDRDMVDVMYTVARDAVQIAMGGLVQPPAPDATKPETELPIDGLALGLMQLEVGESICIHLENYGEAATAIKTAVCQRTGTHFYPSVHSDGIRILRIK